MDLKREFGDVGLMTGDITIDSMAKVIVMTTEVSSEKFLEIEYAMLTLCMFDFI